MKKITSFLLVICMITSLFVGIIPQEAQAAEEIITDAATLQARLNGNTQTVFTLSGTLLLDKTISIPAGRNITIRSTEGTRATIRPGSADWPIGVPLFNVSANATVTFQNMTISGTLNADNVNRRLAQGIAVEIGGATVTLNSVSIFDCNGGTKSGAGLSVGGAYPGNRGELILDGCVFWNNVTSLSTATCGGAIYIGSNYNVTMKKVEFTGNEAHSGGCMYIAYSNVFAENCKFGYNGPESSNKASQRGGAIHCHGTVGGSCGGVGIG